MRIAQKWPRTAERESSDVCALFVSFCEFLWQFSSDTCRAPRGASFFETGLPGKLAVSARVRPRGRRNAIDLFQDARQANARRAQPLAARMRPRSLDEFVGQEHFMGPGKLLRRLLLADRLSSVIFYGPPGTGKTALAHVIAQQTRCRFRQLNAVAAGTKEVRELLREAVTEL